MNHKSKLILTLSLFFVTSAVSAQINVITEKVKTGQIRKLLKFTGETRPLVESYAAADVSGPVAEILVEDGQRVEQNQALAKIDDTRFEIALRMAEASLERAKQQLIEDQRDYERSQTLFKKDAITQKTFDMAETALIKSKTNVKQAKADYDKAKLDLNRCIIKAPIKGFFVDRSIEIGQAMGRGQNMGKVIFLDTIYVEAKISERDIGKIKVGQKCMIEDKFPGEVAYINLYADRSRAFKVKIRVQNPDVTFKANMFVRGSIILEQYDEAPLFSSQAIRNEFGKLHVFTVENGIAKKREIEIIAQEGEFTYADPIEAGMEIVTVGQDNLKNESEITIRNKQSKENTK